MSKFKILGFSIFLFIFQLIFVTGLFAASSIDTAGLDSQDTALMAGSGLASNSNLATIIGMLIKSVLGFLGIVFLALTIMAGFKWMTSQGHEDSIKKAKESLTNSIIGLIIVIAAYAITWSVFTYLPFAGGGGAGGAIITP